MKELSVLTPPLLMCAVVVIAIVAFLRHEMHRSRPGSEGQPPDIRSAEQLEDQDLDSTTDGRGASSATDGR
jgi:hypothetical protein